MARTFGEMAEVGVLVDQGPTLRYPGMTSGHAVPGALGVSLPTLGLKILFEQEDDGGVVMLVRGHTDLLDDASGVEGDMLEILPVAANTVGIRLRRRVVAREPS